MALDWDIVEKMQEDEERRLRIKSAKKGVFVDNFVRFLPWHLKEGIISNPGVNLLYIAEQFGLQKQYKDALDSIGYSPNDYILFALSCCRDADSFENMMAYRWLTSDCFDVRFFDAKHIVIQTNFDELEIYKNNEVEQRRELLLLHKDEICDEGSKDECHFLTYECVKNSRPSNFAVAKTGIVNDVYGPMIHSWVELQDRTSIDLANGYTMDSDDYNLLHKVSMVSEVSRDQIILEGIPHSCSDNKKLVRSLPYLMYKQK